MTMLREGDFGIAIPETWESSTVRSMAYALHSRGKTPILHLGVVICCRCVRKSTTDQSEAEFAMKKSVWNVGDVEDHEVRAFVGVTSPTSLRLLRVNNLHHEMG